MVQAIEHEFAHEYHICVDSKQTNLFERSSTGWLAAAQLGLENILHTTYICS